MFTTLLAPKPVWLPFFLGHLALAIAVFGGIYARLDFWGILSLLVQLVLGLLVLTIAVALTWQHQRAARSGLNAIIAGLVCVHALALVVGSVNSI